MSRLCKSCTGLLMLPGLSTSCIMQWQPTLDPSEYAKIDSRLKVGELTYLVYLFRC